MTKLKLIVVTIVVLFVHINALSDNYIKREFRSVWLTTVYSIDWPSTTGTGASAATSQKNEMTKYLDQLKNDGFNAVYFQVRPMADAFYKSSYEPWSSYLTGSRGSAPTYDPLEFVVAECHKRGLECHAWVNPYRFSSGTNWNTSYDNAIRNKGWLLSYTSTSDNNGGTSTTTIFNPGIDEARQHIINVCSEIVNNYDVDGLVFDDYFYPNGMPTGSSAADYTTYVNSGSTLTMADWRRDNVNKMVQGVYDMIQSSKPWVRFGISPAGAACSNAAVAAKHGVEPLSNYCSANDWQYDGIFSDPVQWLQDGSIDYISPQLYWFTTHSTNPFGPMTQWWSKVAKQFGRHHYASHSITVLGTSNTTSNWQEIGKQVQLSRDYTENDAAGCVFYSHNKISGKTVSGLGEWLYSNKFQAHALPPAIDWKNAPELGKVTGFKKSGNVLSWNSLGENVRYAVYAIPEYYTKDQVQCTVSKGIDANYLLGMAYGTTFEISDGISSGFYYAVCALDRYGNEYEPRYSNEYEIPATKVSLTSPINSAVVKSPATFSWTAVSGATFRLQISKDEKFATIDIDKSNLTSNSVTVDITSLGSNTTCYWRVITSENEKDNVSSDVATFVTAKLEPAPSVTLLSPETGTVINSAFDLTFTSADVDSYKLEISRVSDFSTVSKTVTSGFATSSGTVACTIGSSDLASGTYFWRVTTSKAGYAPTVSDVWTFVLDIYGNEDGYEVKKDDYAYTVPSIYLFENMWVRSVDNGYNNFPARADWGMNRGMCVIDGIIYIVGRVSNNSSADCYIDRYNAATGEFIGQLELTSDVQSGYFPCNDIMKDNAGNLLVNNLTLNVSSTPLLIHKIDKITGEATVVASVTHTSGKRIDHCAVYGDVSSGNFYILAGTSHSESVIKWVFKNGKQTSSQLISLSDFYPSSGEPGLSVRVYPKDDNLFFMNASMIHPTLYDFTSGDIVDSFENSNTGVPQNEYANGFTHFTIADKNYIAYSYNPVWSSDGYTYTGGPHQMMIASIDDEFSYSSIKPMFAVPNSGMGDVYSFYADEIIDHEYVYNQDGEVCGVNLYYYVPSNGIAAYSFADEKSVTYSPEFNKDLLSVTIGENAVYVNQPADVEIYAISGLKVLSGKNIEKLSTETLPCGVYILKCGNSIGNKVVKFSK